MRAHRELVDHEPPVAGLKHLDRKHAGDAEAVGDAARDVSRLVEQLAVGVWRRGNNLGADAVALHGLDQRPGGPLATRAAGRELRKLANEINLLFGEQTAARLCEAIGAQPVGGVGRRAHDAHALAVVATDRGLENRHATVCRDEIIECLGVANLAPNRHRQPQLGEAHAHVKFVLGEGQSLRGRLHRKTGILDGTKHGEWNVLVVKSDHVDGLGKLQDLVKFGVVANLRGRNGCRRVGGLGQDFDVEPHVQRRRHHHSGQLAATDNTDARFRHASIFAQEDALIRRPQLLPWPASEGEALVRVRAAAG